jgi:predicted nucleotidyltransferase
VEIQGGDLDSRRPPQVENLPFSSYIVLMRRDDVIARLKEAEPALRRFGVAGLYLFGSHARDEAGPNSDVDVFIDKDQARAFGFDEFMDAYLLLQESIGEHIDYGTREGLHPLLRPTIEREAIRVF